jgi:hypothetical protein
MVSKDEIAIVINRLPKLDMGSKKCLSCGNKAVPVGTTIYSVGDKSRSGNGLCRLHMEQTIIATAVTRDILTGVNNA